MIVIIVIIGIIIIALIATLFDNPSGEIAELQQKAKILGQAVDRETNERYAKEKELTLVQAEYRGLQHRMEEVRDHLSHLIEFKGEFRPIATAQGKMLSLIVSQNAAGQVQLLWFIIGEPYPLPAISAYRAMPGVADSSLCLFSGQVVRKHLYLDAPPAAQHTYSLIATSPVRSTSWNGCDQLERLDLTVSISRSTEVPPPKALPAPNPQTEHLRELKSRFKQKVAGLKAFTTMKNAARKELASIPEEERDFVAAHLDGWIAELFEKGEL